MQAFDLTGRVAVVTGGNGGIGLGMARGLADAGASIVVAARNADKGAEAVADLTARGAKAAFVTVDVTDAGSVAALVAATLQAHGRLDVLVNNAGIAIRKQPQEYTLDEWHAVVNTNLTSAFICCQAVYPAMKEQGGGKIINIGSMMSLFGAAFSAPYASSKGGIVQLTRSLATAWGVDNVQVNAVLPGWIDTDLTRATRTMMPGFHERIVDRTPERRWGTIDDLAGIAVFLGGPASDFITGAAIPVDGGYSVQG